MKKLFAIISLLLATVSVAAAQLDVLWEQLEELGGPDISGAETIQLVTNSEGALAGAIIKGGFRLKSDVMDVFANEMEYSFETGVLKFGGDVSIYKDGVIYRGEQATYNTRTGDLDATKMRSAVEPLFFETGSLDSNFQNLTLIETEDTKFTTEDSDNPTFYLRSEKMSIYPEDRVVFRHTKAYVGDTPVFYFPYLSQPLEEEMGYTFVPGYRSNLGFFLLNQYGTTIGDHSVIKYKGDIYSMRGVGLGFDIDSRRMKNTKNFGKFKFYWVYDGSPEENNTFSSVRREDVDSSRYRINLQHRVYLPGPEESGVYLDVDVNKISDEFFYEDFFQWEFRDDPQPDNFLNLVKRTDQGELSLLARFRGNDFYQSDSRLPEIAWEMARQPIKNSGLFYTSVTSFGILRDELGDDDRNRLREQVRNLNNRLSDPSLAAAVDPAGTRTTLDDLRMRLVEPEFTRFHTYHEVLFPKLVGGFLSVTPRAGVGYTNYSSVSGTVAPDNTSRAIVAAGLDTSLKFSRVYDDVSWPAMGLNGLRHVVQPYANYSFVGAENQGEEFKGIDRLALSTRPRPLDVTNYTAIDSLRDWNILRLGVYNRLQTKRNNGTLNWLTTNTYFDAFLDDPEYDRNFSNLYQDIEWNPLPWVRANVSAQVPLFGDDFEFTEVNTRLSFLPVDYLSFSIGHRLLQDHPFFEDSSLIDFSTYARISENWGISIYERFEMEDNTLETQQYSIHRDLTSWVASLGAIVRDHRGEQEYGLLFSLTLKDFPSLRIPVDFDPQGGAR